MGIKPDVARFSESATIFVAEGNRIPVLGLIVGVDYTSATFGKAYTTRVVYHPFRTLKIIN